MNAVVDTVRPNGAETGWKQTGRPHVNREAYTEDDVITAFQTGDRRGEKRGIEIGKQQAFEEQKRQDEALLKERVDLTAEQTLEVISEIRNLGSQVVAANLRVNSLNHFDILLVVSSQAYRDKTIYAIYEKIEELEDKFSADDYFISFSLVWDGDSLNSSKVTSQGYYHSLIGL